MIRPSSSVPLQIVVALLLATPTAWADTVLVLPTRGQVDGPVPADTIETETRIAITALGHQVVPDADLQAAVRALPDSTPDTTDEYAAMAKRTAASWVVVPVATATGPRQRLELTVYQAGLGRLESVAREVSSDALRQQIQQMVGVILRPEGVGTSALPWEHPTSKPPAQPPPAPGTKVQPMRPSSTTNNERGATFTPWVGAGLGLSTALSRPEGATGSSTSGWGALRAGLGFGEHVEAAATLRGHVSGPRATVVVGSARYLFALGSGDALRIGPEVAGGLFVQQGGAKDKSLVLQVGAVASWKVVGPLSIEASVGDLAWVPASAGTIVLCGAGAYGVARF